MKIKRDLQLKIEKWLFKGKILIVYGARQVGKTTLAKTLLLEHGNIADYYNCEIIQVRQALEKEDPISLKKFLGDAKLIVLDEAQKVPNIGRTLKLLIDTYPDMQIIATGSSSFDLSNQVNEPLTGRAIEFSLYPFSLRELSQCYRPYELDAQLPFYLRFGLYPDIAQSGETDAETLLTNISNQYLYKDVLEFEHLKRSDLLVQLLQLLALQIGQEVSIHELAVSLQCARDTVLRYLDLLEKSFVIFHLRAFSRNPRKEISKKRKIYFYDVGIRNSLISRYTQLPLRDDVGVLWENFCISERRKFLQITDQHPQQYFWRSLTQKEVDYVEEYNNILRGYEFKWKKNNVNPPKDFLTYPNSSVTVINHDNYTDFFGCG